MDGPFPKYIGACGRLIVETEKGRTILNYIDKPFKLRVRFYTLSLTLFKYYDSVGEDCFEFARVFTVAVSKSPECFVISDGSWIREHLIRRRSWSSLLHRRRKFFNC